MSTERLTPDSLSPQDKEWEANMLSFVENNEGKSPPVSPRKKLPIHRRTLTVILSAAGTILLAVVVLFVTLFAKPQPQPQEETPSQPQDIVTTPAISLLDKTGADANTAKSQLQQVDIQNASDSYSIFYDDTAKAYVIKKYEDLTLSSSLVLTLRTHTETIQALEKVNTVASLSAFGLDEPQATATITYADGSVAHIRLGNMTPSETGFYGQFNDSKDVYIFASDNVGMFRFHAAAYVNTLLVAKPTIKTSDTNGAAVLRSATFSGSAHPSPLTLRRSNHQDRNELTYFPYIITAPYLRATNDSMTTALSSFTSLSATQALVLHPTEEQKQKLGFNNPVVKINATMAVETEEDSGSDDSDAAAPKVYYNSTDYVITVGSISDDGNYVVMVDGINAIFLVSKDEYYFLFDLTYESAVNPFLFFKNIHELSRISIRINDEVYDFHLTHFPEKERPDDQLVVTKDGVVYSTPEFRELYGLMMDLRRDDTVEVQKGQESPVELALYDINNELHLSAKYYNATGSLCAVETSEGEIFATHWSYVSFFMEQVQNYLDGKDVLMNT